VQARGVSAGRAARKGEEGHAEPFGGTNATSFPSNCRKAPGCARPTGSESVEGLDDESAPGVLAEDHEEI
jgi:hypothetical protein